VIGIERHAGLAASAAERLARLGFAEVEITTPTAAAAGPRARRSTPSSSPRAGPRVPEVLRGQLAPVAGW
jgi:protein-L-isoaspartate O-methyltransferase